MAKSKNDISHYSLGLKSLVYHKNPQDLAEPQQEKKQWEESYLQLDLFQQDAFELLTDNKSAIPKLSDLPVG
jgi:hypothetical protein